MSDAQSVKDMNLLFLLHDVPKFWKIKDKDYFMSLHFSTLKILQIKNNYVLALQLF